MIYRLGRDGGGRGEGHLRGFHLALLTGSSHSRGQETIWGSTKYPPNHALKEYGNCRELDPMTQWSPCEPDVGQNSVFCMRSSHFLTVTGGHDDTWCTQVLKSLLQLSGFSRTLARAVNTALSVAVLSLPLNTVSTLSLFLSHNCREGFFMLPWKPCNTHLALSR